MALEFTPQEIESGYQSTESLNQNFSDIQEALEDGLSRSGNGPNAMSANIDMQNNRIFNLPDATLDSEPVTLGQAINVFASSTAVYASWNANAYWVRNSSLSAWSPDLGSQTVTVSFISNGSVLATMDVVGTLNTTTGAITITNGGTTGDATTLSVTNNNTIAPTVIVTHTISAVTASPVFFSITGVAGQNGADGSNGTPGTDGGAVTAVYRRSATLPSTPSPSSGTPAGWYASVNDVPAGSDPMWMSIGARTPPSANYTWEIPLRVEGATGESGQAVTMIFRRSALQPSTPANSAGIPASWYDNTGDVPAGADPMWSSVGTRATSSSDWVWQTPIRIQGQDGTSVAILGELNDVGDLPISGDVGDGYIIAGDLYVWDGSTWINVGQIQGPAGTNGLSVVEIFVYRRSSTAPSTPTGGTFNFSTNTITPPTDWYASIPAGSDPVYISVGFAATYDPSGSASITGWSSPVKAFEDGAPGTDGLDGAYAWANADVQVGAWGNITLTKNATTGGTATDGSIRIQGTVLVFRGNTTLTGLTDHAVMTPYVSTTRTIDVFYLMASRNTLSSTRFGTGFAANNFFVAEYDAGTETWYAIGSGNEEVSFTPATSDAVIGIGSRPTTGDIGIRTLASLVTNVTFTSSIAPVFIDNAAITDAMVAGLAASKITGTLTDSQIADVDAAKLTGELSTAQLGTGTVTADTLAANSVTAGAIAAGAVTTAKIAAGAITADEIASNAITAAKISAGAVETAKLAAGAITATTIATGAVTADKVAANAVTADKIAANAVTASKIAAGSVTADKIAAATITGDKIAAGAITASSIATGNLTAAVNVTTGSVQISSTGKIYSGKSTFGAAASGFFIGMDGGVAKFRFGNSDNSKSITWDGTNLSLEGGALINVDAIDLIDATLSDTGGAYDAYSAFKLDSDGFVYYGENLSGVTQFYEQYRFCNFKGPEDYEYRMTRVSGETSLYQGSLSTWVSGSSDRTYSLIQTTAGSKSFVGTIEIRRASDSVVLASATVSLSVTK